MAKKKQSVPEYGTVTRKGTLYYRTRITDADGKQVSLYATTCEELHEKQLEARRQVDEIIFHRKHPTVAEYCEKWLLMQSAKVSTATIKGYRQNMKNYVISSLGDMYMEEVTADDIRLTLVPLSQKSKGLYDTVNMLIKCVFYSAERSQLITDNPCVGISAKGGKASKKKDALTDQQVAVLLDTVKELPPYLFIMIGLYSGLRREEILALQWDCVFLDESTPYISVRRAWRAEHNRPVISTVLKTKAAKRDIPIPKCLVDCQQTTDDIHQVPQILRRRFRQGASARFLSLHTHITERKSQLQAENTLSYAQLFSHNSGSHPLYKPVPHCLNSLIKVRFSFPRFHSLPYSSDFRKPLPAALKMKK